MVDLAQTMSLVGKTALVTGGTGFLGVAICEALLECGARVIATARGRSNSHLISRPHLVGKLQLIISDLSTEDGVEDMLDDVDSPIDILVNDMCQWPTETSLWATSWDVIETSVRANLVSPIFLSKRIMDGMVGRGTGGSIINVGSMYGRVAPDHRIYRDSKRGNAVDYGAAKAGLMQATRYLAAVGGKHGIRCNSISPGPFPHPGTFDVDGWFEDELRARTMLGRVGQADELKGVIVFLASDMSSYVTGADIPIDGGWTAW